MSDTGGGSMTNLHLPKKKTARRHLFRGWRRKDKTTRSTTTSVAQFAADERSRYSVPTSVWQQTTGKTVVHGTKTTTTTTTTPKEAPPQQQQQRTAPPPPRPTGWLHRNPRFVRLCDAVFDSIDTDGSGTVDEKELYAGLLLIHLKLGAYAGPAACRPLQRQRCHQVFAEMDTDESGQLDKHEFQCVMVYLFGNVIIRVLVQWSMTLLIVPLLAQYMLDAIYATVDYIYDTVTTLDDYFWIADQVELTIEYVVAKCIAYTPRPLQAAAHMGHEYLAMVPQSVWNTVPLTLLCSILGIAVVPYIIFSIDEFFTKAASQSASQQKQAKSKQE